MWPLEHRQPGNEPGAASADTPFPTEQLSGKVLQGGMFLAGRYGLGVLVSLANMLVMTWWIGPHAYGLFVTAIGIVAFLASLARVGIDTYLVRRETPPDSHTYGTATVLILGSSLALVGAGLGLTPLLIPWFGSREFVLPYLILLLTIPVTGLTGIPMASLERALEFRRVAAVELMSQLAGLVVATVLAFQRAGVWAPVFGQVTWQIFTLFGVLSAAPVPRQLRFDRAEIRPMLSYGLSLTASLRTWQLRTLVNPLLVGRFVGTDGVAFVGLAIRIADALGSFRLATGRIAIAALARLQKHREEFARALEQVLYLQVLSLGPILCIFALSGPFAVRHLIGVRWMPSLAVYPFVAAGVLVNSVYNLQASALFVIGNPRLVTKAYSIHVVLLVFATLVLLPRMGIVGYGWAELVACAAYAAIHAGLARTVTLSYRRLLPWMTAFAAGLLVSAISNVRGLVG